MTADRRDRDKMRIAEKELQMKRPSELALIRIKHQVHLSKKMVKQNPKTKLRISIELRPTNNWPENN